MDKAEIEILHFDCKDIITTSHDNGFADFGDLVRATKDIINKFF